MGKRKPFRHFDELRRLHQWVNAGVGRLLQSGQRLRRLVDVEGISSDHLAEP
jgi:hypothetical protein